MLGLTALTVVADSMAAHAGVYAITVVDTWGEGIAEDTSRGEIVFLEGIDGCAALEMHMGGPYDERLPTRFRIFRCADGLRFQLVYDDRRQQEPPTLSGSVAASGTLDAVHAAPHGETEIDLSFSADGFTYKERGRACLLRYPHGCLIPLPWKSTREEVRGIRSASAQAPR